MGKIAYRRVAPDWQHPKHVVHGQERWKPMYEYASRAGHLAEGITAGDEFYMPNWTPEQATAWQVYEEVTEGTPITKVYPDLNTMAREIAEECGHSYEAMRKKILASLQYGYWYVPVPKFEVGGEYHDLELKEI
jgi:hypothetical protein